MLFLDEKEETSNVKNSELEDEDEDEGEDEKESEKKEV